MPGLSLFYQLVVKPGDRLAVRVERKAKAARDGLERRLQEALLAASHELRDSVARGWLEPPAVELLEPGRLPRQPRTGKVKRVVDLRGAGWDFGHAVRESLRVHLHAEGAILSGRADPGRGAGKTRAGLGAGSVGATVSMRVAERLRARRPRGAPAEPAPPELRLIGLRRQDEQPDAERHLRPLPRPAAAAGGDPNARTELDARALGRRVGLRSGRGVLRLPPRRPRDAGRQREARPLLRRGRLGRADLPALEAVRRGGPPAHLRLGQQPGRHDRERRPRLAVVMLAAAQAAATC